MALGKNNELLALIMLISAIVFVSGCTSSPSASEQKTYRIGILSGLDFFSGSVDGFKEKMAELGYVEGKNIVYDVRRSNVDSAAEQVSLEKFINDDVDLIFSFPTEASLEAKKATEGTGIPVVFANSGLDGSDLVNSVREPGGNITGVQFPTADNAVQRIEILHEMIPNAKTIWIAYLKGYPIIPRELELLNAAADSLNLTLIEVPATSIGDIESDLKARNGAEMDAILIIPEPLTASPEAFAVIAEFAEEHKIPIGGALLTTENYGSLFGYTPNSIEVGRQAATLADKILDGVPAGTIPVLSAENELVINNKLASKLGIIVGDDLLSRAKEVIR